MSAATARRTQTIWGWHMALSLFLAGAGAGAYLMGFVLSVGSERDAISDVSLPASVACAVLGIIMLVRHTGRRGHVVLAFSRPRSSWMSRGAIALALFLLLAIVDLILWFVADGYASGAGHTVVGVIACLAAIVVITYTGMLLRSVRPIAFWDSAVLPALFFLSGITGGMLLLGLLLGIRALAIDEAIPAADLVVAACLGLVVLEAATVALHLWRSRDGDAAASTSMIISGVFASAFWAGVVVIGFVAPVVICVYSLVQPSAAGLIAVGVTGLAGNALLKYLILAVGDPRALAVTGHSIPVPAAARTTVSQYIRELKRTD